ncbi:hypothetical protein H6F51_19300 [Cyanobacteria bacterium FACHB-DQ100]|nr:hypothetical protein [Cyanobacteria bacterium FACHB-DQ100]
MNFKTFSVWVRFARMQLSPWFTLIQAGYQALRGCSYSRTRLMISIAKLNILTIYDLLDDLIRYPPY